MELLNKAIARWYDLARVRGCNPAHPVQLTQMENDTETARAFIIVCSFTEPTFSEVPYNTLWLNMNPGSPEFRSLRRRTSHSTDGVHRGTWEEITDLARIYLVDQFFRFVVENSADVGLDPADTTIPHATPKVMGVVQLEAEQADAVVVVSNHPAMSDKRYPNDHDHPDYPRKLVKISATHYAIIEGNAPVAGDVLYLVRAHPTDRNVYYARWGKPTVDHIDWVSPRLERVIISLPGNASYMNDNGTMDLIGTAVWTDRTEVDPEGLVWSIQQNTVGVTIDPATGVVTCPKLQFDTDLLVKTKLRDVVFNKWVEAEYLLRIIVKSTVVTLVSIEIVGVTEMMPADQTTFGVVGHYSDGSSAALVPDTFASNNSNALTLNGFIGVAKRVTSDTVVTLSAVKDGLTDTHDVLIRQFKPVTLTIQGAAVIDELTEQAYSFYVAYNDGTQEQTTVDSFTCDNPKGVVTGNKVAAAEVVVDEAAILTATKMVNGVTVNATKNITLRNVSNPPTKIPESILVSGATLVQEKTSSTYTAKVVYSDGSKEDLKPAELTKWETLVGTISASGASGVFTAPDVTVDTPNTVTCKATVAGYAIQGHLDLMVKNEVTITLESIVITGAVTVDEGSSTQYQADAYFTDGSVRGVAPGEMEQWQVTGTSTITNAGMLTAQQVTQDTLVTISLRANIGGVVKTDTHDVTIKDRAVIPASMQILGPTTANENTTSQYSGQITMSDGSKVAPDSITSWAIKSGVGTISAAGLATWPKVLANTPCVIELKAMKSGQAFTATLNVNVINLGNIVSVALLGPAQITEGQTGAYTMEATLEDGTKSTFTTPSLAFVTPTSNATISGNTVVASQVSADVPLTIRGTVTAEGKSWTADKDIVIKNVPLVLSSIVIQGPNTTPESTATATYTCVATMSDNSSKNVNPTWSISNAGGLTGVSISTSGILTAPAVTANTNIVITATYVEGGVTKTATKTVTITDTSVPPVGTSKIKFGIVPRVNSPSGFNKAFLDSLTQELTGTVSDRIYMPAFSSTQENDKWGYFAMPKAKCGYAYVRAVTSTDGKPGFVSVGGQYGFAGSWDAAKDYPDAWDFTGPWEGKIDGVDYVVYRNDFPFNQMEYTYEFQYHSNDPMSGNP